MLTSSSLPSDYVTIAIENGPVEIVDLPIDSMVIFHSKLLVYQRVIIVYIQTFCLSLFCLCNHSLKTHLTIYSNIDSKLINAYFLVHLPRSLSFTLSAATFAPPTRFHGFQSEVSAYNGLHWSWRTISAPCLDDCDSFIYTWNLMNQISLCRSKIVNSHSQKKILYFV